MARSLTCFANIPSLEGSVYSRPAWNTKEDLANYLTKIEEAEKRDHRKLGKQLDLFHFQETAPGMVFWHPKGWVIYQLLQKFMRDSHQNHKIVPGCNRSTILGQKQ